MTEGECAAMLAVAGKIYGRDLSQGLVEAWAGFMGDISADEGARAIREHVTESPHFPTVADIRKRVSTLRVGPMNPGAAWEEVRKAIGREGRNRSPEWTHPAIASAVMALGWVEICNTTDDDLATLRAQFERYYRAAYEGRAKVVNAGALEVHLERRGILPIGDVVKGLLEGK